MEIKKIREFEKIHWDFIIIGTGMGGGTIGYQLSKAGKKILFLESGKNLMNSDNTYKGKAIDEFIPKNNNYNKNELFSNCGKLNYTFLDKNKNYKPLTPLIGTGTGGSGALYGMVLERFFPEDFEPKKFHSDSNNKMIPEKWPISFKELEPYYEKAEKLFRVRSNDSDPLRKEQNFIFNKSIPLTKEGKEFKLFLEKKGLNPYSTPLACDFKPNCRLCQGFLCDKNCKNEPSKICLKPAIEDYGATLITNCEVTYLDANKDKINFVCANINKDNKFKFKGNKVILAAGALSTPLILLSSKSEFHPDGLANSSGCVGRNFMRHYIDLYPIISKVKIPESHNSKELNLNDFYIYNSTKLGTFQAFGKLSEKAAINDLKNDFDWGLPKLKKLFKIIRIPIFYFLKYLFSHSLIYASIVEDSPSYNNRIYYSEEKDENGRFKVIIDYSISEYDKNRIELMRNIIKNVLKSKSFITLKQAENSTLLAHVCGTCRFGDDKKSSVLDKNCKSHDLENLYIVDSSFFPTSAGLNPSLTIIANALRVADHLLKE